MDYDKELTALAAENLALSIIVGNILSKLAKIPTLREAIIEGFDQSADVVDSVSMIHGKGSSPDHAIKLSASSRKSAPWFLAMRASLGPVLS